MASTWILVNRLLGVHAFTRSTKAAVRGELSETTPAASNVVAFPAATPGDRERGMPSRGEAIPAAPGLDVQRIGARLRAAGDAPPYPYY
jgi:hypothetical protein